MKPDIVQPQILSLTIMCPKGVTVHIAAWDGCAIDWEARKIVVHVCPNCGTYHIFNIG